MGYWGHRPMDGDGPNDLVGVVDRKVGRLIVRELEKPIGCLKNWEKTVLWERLGFVQIMSKVHAIPLKAAKKCIEIIDRCLADDEWLGSWRDPALCRRNATLMKDYLVANMPALKRDPKAGTFAGRGRKKPKAVKCIPSRRPQFLWIYDFSEIGEAKSKSHSAKFKAGRRLKRRRSRSSAG